jgi:hypothetical protein
MTEKLTVASLLIKLRREDQYPEEMAKIDDEIYRLKIKRQRLEDQHDKLTKHSRAAMGVIEKINSILTNRCKHVLFIDDVTNSLFLRTVKLITYGHKLPDAMAKELGQYGHDEKDAAAVVSALQLLSPQDMAIIKELNYSDCAIALKCHSKCYSFKQDTGQQDFIYDNVVLTSVGHKMLGDAIKCRSNRECINKCDICDCDATLYDWDRMDEDWFASACAATDIIQHEDDMTFHDTCEVHLKCVCFAVPSKKEDGKI